MIEVAFYNVTITISAESAQAAYDRLAELLDPACKANELEYTTDTYEIANQAPAGRHAHDTSELFD